LDLLGLPISLTFQGRTVYKTGIGAFYTLITLIILLAYSGTKITRLLNQS